jgi:hypothetical protein
MSKMRKLCCLFLLLFTATWAQAQPVNTFMIDDFNNTNGATVTPKPFDGLGTWSGFGPGIVNTIGGNRVLGNYLTDITPGDPGPFTSSTNIFSGVFSIDNPFNTRSSGQVIWQGNATTPGTNPIISDPAGFALGNRNFDTIVSTPNFYFQWNVVNSDFRVWTYVIRAYTNNAANYFEGSITINPGSGVNFTGLVNLPRSSFIVGAGAPSWADIDAISCVVPYTPIVVAAREKSKRPKQRKRRRLKTLRHLRLSPKPWPSYSYCVT